METTYKHCYTHTVVNESSSLNPSLHTSSLSPSGIMFSVPCLILHLTQQSSVRTKASFSFITKFFPHTRIASAILAHIRLCFLTSYLDRNCFILFHFYCFCWQGRHASSFLCFLCCTAHTRSIIDIFITQILQLVQILQFWLKFILMIWMNFSISPKSKIPAKIHIDGLDEFYN